MLLNEVEHSLFLQYVSSVLLFKFNDLKSMWSVNRNRRIKRLLDNICCNRLISRIPYSNINIGVFWSVVETYRLIS